MPAKIYIRAKNDEGAWRYQGVKIGKGYRTGDLTPPFFVRPFRNGKQAWHKLGAQTFEQAKVEATTIDAAIDAESQGLTVAELAANPNRQTLKDAIDFYLAKKARKKAKTYNGYVSILGAFTEHANLKFLNEVTHKTLEKFANHLTAEGYATRTVFNMMLVVVMMLKANKYKTDFSLKDDLGKYEVEEATPFTNAELEKLFAAANQEETDRYKFFLLSGCREQEVQFAAWSDIDFEKKTYTVRAKEDVGFTLKNHESRVVPLPNSLIKRLKTRREKAPHPRWIFVNKDGLPEGHFLKKLKSLALRAGLNCGNCKTTRNKGRYERKRPVDVTCATDPVCQHIYLHRFRKTCATRWNEAGIDTFALQEWLGHKDPATTRRYVGRANIGKLSDKINLAAGD
jgi:integrase/recombinase XerD